MSIILPDKEGQQGDNEQKFVSILPPDKGGQGGLFTKKKYIPYRADLTQKAQQNRANPTPFEYDMYYKILKVGVLEDYKFLRQKPLLDYIVDFYCAEIGLVIEVDGDSHTEQKMYDYKRTKDLEGIGLHVMRFTNLEVLHNKEGIFESIVCWIQNHPKNPPAPLIRGEDTELPMNCIENHKHTTSTSLIRGEDTELPMNCIENHKHTTSTSLIRGEEIGYGSEDVRHPSSVNDDSATLYSLLRLRIPSQYFTGESHFLPVLEGAALIREIHTFGEQLGI